MQLMHRVPVQEATWCPDYGCLFAAEISITELWRLIASFNPFYSNTTNEPNTETGIHVADLWVSVPKVIFGKLLSTSISGRIQHFRAMKQLPSQIPSSHRPCVVEWGWHLIDLALRHFIQAKLLVSKSFEYPLPWHSQ
jgi:hypothetical protein